MRCAPRARRPSPPGAGAPADTVSLGAVVERCTAMHAPVAYASLPPTSGVGVGRVLAASTRDRQRHDRARRTQVVRRAAARPASMPVVVLAVSSDQWQFASGPERVHVLRDAEQRVGRAPSRSRCASRGRRSARRATPESRRSARSATCSRVSPPRRLTSRPADQSAYSSGYCAATSSRVRPSQWPRPRSRKPGLGGHRQRRSISPTISAVCIARAASELTSKPGRRAAMSAATS